MPSLDLGSGQFDANLSINMVPLFGVTNSATSINEGSSLLVTITSELVPDSTTLYWSVSRPEDFTAGSGSVVVIGNTASFTLTATNDFTTEGDEVVYVYIRTDSQLGPIVAQSQFLLYDTSLNPTYSVTSSVDSINEGENVSFTVTTTNVPNGTTLYWTNDGTSTSSDFTGSPAQSGSFVINSGTASYGTTVAINDTTTEGAETIIFNLRTGSTAGTIVASKTVILRDTSQSPSYNITPSVTSFNESGSVTFTVATTGIANGTVLYWTAAGSISGTNGVDVNVTSGSVTINSNLATFVISAVADLTTEGNEVFNVTLRSGSTSGPTLAISDTVTLLDSSLSPSYSIIIQGGNYSRNEGTDFTLQVDTVGVANGTTLYITFNGTISADDIAGGLQAVITITANYATSLISILGDLTTEGPETFVMELRTGSHAGPIVAQSPLVTVNDTSQNISVSWANVSVNENASMVGTVTTTGLANGTTLYWTITHITTTAADFISESGSFTINSNQGTINIFHWADFTTEGNETYTVSIRTGSTTGPVKYTSGTLTIVDSSKTQSVSITPSTTTPSEGDTVTWNVTGTNIDDNTTLYWSNIGTTVSADFTQGTNDGSFTYVNPSIVGITRTLVNDLTTEGLETIIIRVWRGGVGFVLLGQSVQVNVSDTSQTPAITVQWLGGAGGGGGGGSGCGGGGGGGEFYVSSFSAQIGSNYNITVGSGGQGGGIPAGGDVGGQQAIGQNGQNTQIAGLALLGGGGGGSGYTTYRPTASAARQVGRSTLWGRDGNGTPAYTGGGGGGMSPAVFSKGGIGPAPFNWAGGFGRGIPSFVNRMGGGGAGVLGNGQSGVNPAPYISTLLRGGNGGGGRTVSSIYAPASNPIEGGGGGGGGTFAVPLYSNRAGAGGTGLATGGTGAGPGLGNGGNALFSVSTGGGGSGGDGPSSPFPSNPAWLTAGGAGSAGTVIIKYPSSANTVQFTGLSVFGQNPDTTSSPGFKIHRIAPGSGTIRFP